MSDQSQYYERNVGVDAFHMQVMKTHEKKCLGNSNAQDDSFTTNIDYFPPSPPRRRYFTAFSAGSVVML